MRGPLDNRPVWPSLAAFVATLLLALLAYAVLGRAAAGGAVLINLPLIALFIWSLRRPWFVSPPVLLIIGLLQDLMIGAPLGVWALAHLAAFTLARDREADGAGGDVGPVSARFAVLAGVAFLVAWGAGSVAIGAVATFGALITEAVLTILLFPVFAWIFARRKERSAFF
jgi:rod shape-determining protein MreD